MKFDYVNESGGPFYANIDSRITGSSSETAVTPKFAVEYKPSPDWMFYASAAKGFRPGGANSQANTTTCADDLAALGITQARSQYKSDSVWSHEVGTKGRVGHTVTLAASIFNIDWKDIQRRRSLISCPFVFIDNLGSARIRGFDAKITLEPVDGLTLDAGIGYMDATYRQTLFTANGLGTILRKGDRFAVPLDRDPGCGL